MKVQILTNSSVTHLPLHKISDGLPKLQAGLMVLLINGFVSLVCPLEYKGLVVPSFLDGPDVFDHVFRMELEGENSFVFG